MKTKVHTVYKNKAGKRVIGVTTAIGILNKPALLYWAWDLGCKGIDYRKYRDDKADIGTLTHYLILCDIKNEKADTADYTAKQINLAETCFLKYLEWKKTKDIKILLSEKALVSEEFQYGGTFDLLAEIDGIKTLIDFKTGKGIYDEMKIQLSAYMHLIKEHGYLHEEECKTAILRIGRDETEGFEYREFNNINKYWEIFKHCKAIYDLNKKTK